MSYNKVEALREKSDAEKLLLSNDYAGARNKLKKAQQLFPALEHIVPMLTVCEILSASTNIIPGYDVDYYWVLQLMPSSTTADITCQYQKLVSLLQPIKYKFPVTETALKLLQEAYSVLSDKRKRVTFDIKRGTSWVNYESFESDPEKSRNLDKVYVNNVSLQESGSSSSDVISEGCKGQETDTRVDDINSALDPSVGGVQQDFFDFDRFRSMECFETGDIWAVHHRLTEARVGGRYAQIGERSETELEVTWLRPIPVTEGERRWFDAGLPVSCGSFCLDTETTGKITSKDVFSSKCSWTRGITEELFEIYPKKGEVWAVYEDFDLDEWPYEPDTVHGCSFELVEILSDYCRYTGVECGPLVRVDGFKTVFQRRVNAENQTNVVIHVSPRDLYMFAHNVPAFRFTGGEVAGVRGGMFELDRLSLQRGTDDVEEKDSDFLVPAPSPEATTLGPHWSLRDVNIGQVWAVYAGRDSMPRQYVVVTGMTSDCHFHAMFLEPEPVSGHENVWKARNLPVVSGMFRARDTTTGLDLRQLSHPVDCRKSTTAAVYRIFPSKGEVWAVYRNWKRGWSRANYDGSKCWVVEVVADFTDGERTVVARLVEVKGCLTFFQRSQCEDGFEIVRGFSRSEMQCFSHRIPAFRVPGIGRHGIPESSWHLEPVALPPNNGK